MLFIVSSNGLAFLDRRIASLFGHSVGQSSTLGELVRFCIAFQRVLVFFSLLSTLFGIGTTDIYAVHGSHHGRLAI